MTICRLCRPIPRSTLYPALVHFYDAEYLGRAIRVAALFQPINESGVSGMATILVAETSESRRYPARQMMIAALLSRGTVVVLTLILAFALLAGVEADAQASGIMLRRDPGELTPCRGYCRGQRCSRCWWRSIAISNGCG